jgi:hypothetical protein
MEPPTVGTFLRLACVRHANCFDRESDSSSEETRSQIRNSVDPNLMDGREHIAPRPQSKYDLGD